MKKSKEAAGRALALCHALLSEQGELSGRRVAGYALSAYQALSPEEKAQRVAPMFKRLDANGDGKLTPEEIASSDRRMAFSDPAAIDTDKNGEISLVELEAAVTARREEMLEGHAELAREQRLVERRRTEVDDGAGIEPGDRA